ncbi:hypothetical protein OZX72_07410 [Bifidobacterium sp. ESL0769]|uniref:hypothetical protein n=1 Tax=Bifidobacterium sp. ESL0769 TaxID=2983229 RepID=UPI0023F98E39|nr:hypothetical protein [Bifidobacterium sp. ESL0769]WEV67064.1 hypothetical protein OZX72_07410 [Bifidobacterium sp. ESL0769]
MSESGGYRNFGGRRFCPKNLCGLTAEASDPHKFIQQLGRENNSALPMKPNEAKL